MKEKYNRCATPGKPVRNAYEKGENLWQNVCVILLLYNSNNVFLIAGKFDIKTNVLSYKKYSWIQIMKDFVRSHFMAPCHVLF